jgi:hypothetical protein
MPSYPVTIRRCQHIKVNGTQCGSPALRDEKYCYYHLHCQQKNMHVDMSVPASEDRGAITLPTLEDANSIQVGLVEVMRLLVTSQIEHRTASLLLRALRLAASNVKRTSFEPQQPTHVVIDPDCVAHRPIGATAWSTVAGCDYDEMVKDIVVKDDAKKHRWAKQASKAAPTIRPSEFALNEFPLNSQPDFVHRPGPGAAPARANWNFREALLSNSGPVLCWPVHSGGRSDEPNPLRVSASTASASTVSPSSLSP